MQKILSLDFGTKRIGMAVTEGLLAVPVTIIHYQKLDNALQKIMHYCEENQVDRVVLGLSEHKFAQTTRLFGEKLAALLSIPLEYCDETLSSVEVTERLKQRKKPIPKYIDHYAAAYILEEWLILHSSDKMITD